MWTFGPEGLRVAWMGMSAQLEGEGDGEAVMVIGSELMRGIARVSEWPSTVRVVARASELKVGPMIFEAQSRVQAPEQLLPLNAGPRDLVKLHVCETTDRIEAGGLTEDVAEVLERLNKNCDTAARTLKWMGVTSTDLRAWILGRLEKAAAQPEPSAVVVETTGQVRLF